LTDGLDQALLAAGLDLLRADDDLTVFDGAVPTDPATGKKMPPPYVLVYSTVGRPAAHPDTSLRNESSRFIPRWYCHCVGANANASRAVAQRVRTALLDVRPAVDGLSCNPIRQAEDNPPDRDETTGVLVMDAVQVYESYACPA
jgi:hypothetical protein